MSTSSQVRASLEAILQTLGVIDAEKKPLRGHWHKKEEMVYVIDGIDLSLEGDELVLIPSYGTIWHGPQALQEERIHRDRAPLEFAAKLDECCRRKKTAQANHDRRVYGNEW